MFETMFSKKWGKEMKLKNLMKKGIHFLFDSDYRFTYLAAKGIFKNMSDEVYLERLYKIKMGRTLNLNNPKSYTEKLQWLKAYDHNPKYVTMVDKYEVKKYVANLIGEEYIIPTLGVWNDVDSIDFSKLPKQFVLKCTHDSGSVIICKDKDTLDINAVKRKLAHLLKQDFYCFSREWPYKNVKHRIIAEKYMEDITDGELRDYKFFTFSGEPKVLYIAQGRGKNEETVADFFDMDFNHLPFTIDHNTAKNPPHPPKNFELMKSLASKLSQGTPQVRVDFYEVNGVVYFGELTFFHCSGLEAFHPNEWDVKFGDWTILPQNK